MPDLKLRRNGFDHIGLTISKIWNITVAANTIRSGITTASMVAKIFFERNEDALMSSLDESRVTSRIAISAPPTPPLRTAVIDIALVAAVDVTDDAAITKLMCRYEAI